MRKYYLSYWKDHGAKEIFVVKEAKDHRDLYYKLCNEFFNEDDEVLLNGFNFSYRSNMDHYLAAGYPIEEYKPSITEALKPAHFNRNFFYILGYEEKI